MIDKGAPSCGSNTGSTTWGNGSRTVTVRCSDDYSGCTNSYYSNSFGGNVEYSSITIADNAGNTSSCTVPVFLDNTAPTATHSKNSTTAYITCSDTGGSGLRGTNTSKTLSGNSTYISTTCVDNAGNSTSASKTYTKKYTGTIKCYKYSCPSGITPSGSSCSKPAERYICEAHYTLGGLTCSTSLCNSQCATHTYISATSSPGAGGGMKCTCYTAFTCPSGWSGPSNGNCTKAADRDNKTVDCSSSNYSNPTGACTGGYKYASHNCGFYWE
jgi:hypothetical protein